jgi:UDP-glucose 4-epimerase
MAARSNGASRSTRGGAALVKLFITGASGFVGAETLRLALDGGHEVIAPVRESSAAWRLEPYEGRYTRLTIDIGDSVGVAKALMAHKPDAIIHLAWAGVGNAMRFDRSQITENIDACIVLVEGGAAAGVKAFVGVGSQGEYGAGSTMKEDCLPEPTTLYGAAKVAALFLTRQLAAQAGMRHAWLRLFSTYGPRDNDGWLIPMLITEMLAGRRPKTTLGTQYWDYLHVEDVARGVLAAAVSERAQGVFNLGSGKAVQVREVVEHIRDLAAPDMELIFGEIPFRPDQVMHMQADISRLKSHTDWAPRIDIREGLGGTVDYYRNRAG